jgi:hypothetical protein
VLSLFLQLICYINETLTCFLLHKIQFENRNRGNADNDCMLSVDGTNFRFACMATSMAMAMPTTMTMTLIMTTTTATTTPRPSRLTQQLLCLCPWLMATPTALSMPTAMATAMELWGYGVSPALTSLEYLTCSWQAL